MPMPPLVEPIEALSEAEAVRTARHAVLAGFGPLAQRRLAGARVAVVGVGGLGSPVILALAAAGVGALTVIDDDVVDPSNLQRQVLHRRADIGADKVASAVRAVADLAPDSVVREVRERLTAGNADRLLGDADVVIDGTDDFATRIEVATSCERLGVPLVWGVVQEFHAQLTVFWSAPPPGFAPVRLRDLYPPGSVGELPSCAATGVLGALCIQVGGMLAGEAIKLIAGVGEPLLGRIVVVDALRGTQREVPLRSRTSPPPRDATPSRAPDIPRVSAERMLAARAEGATLLDVREPAETATGYVDGSLLVPLAELLAEPERAGEGPVVVICAHGTRARRAAEALAARGVEASVLAGGLAAWR